jgi:hypothetical protein
VTVTAVVEGSGDVVEGAGDVVEGAGDMVSCGFAAGRVESGLAVALALADGGRVAVHVTRPQSAARTCGLRPAWCGMKISTPLTVAATQVPVPIAAYRRCLASHPRRHVVTRRPPLNRKRRQCNNDKGGFDRKRSNCATLSVIQNRLSNPGP